MAQPHASERQNLILASLSKANFAALQPHVEYMRLAQGTVLYDVGAPIRHVYFPRTALISLVGLTVQGQGTEVGMIGENELRLQPWWRLLHSNHMNLHYRFLSRNAPVAQLR